jgi:hypothetical protein
MKKTIGNFQVFKISILALALSCLLAAPKLFADGDTRAATQAEKEFAKTVYDVFAKSLPPGPEGWERTQATEVKELTSVYSNRGEPFLLEYTVAWQDSKKIQQAAIDEANEIQKLAKNPAAINDQAIHEIEKKTSPHDATLKIVMEANRFSTGIYEKVAPAAPVAGGLVFRSDSAYGSSGAWKEGATYIFLGKGWKVNKSDATWVETKPDKAAPSAAAQTIVVKITADPERAKQVISKIDWESLKKLIK